MDSNIIRDAFQSGDFSRLIDGLDVDEWSSWDIVSPLPGTPDATLILARVGRSVIQIGPEPGTLEVSVHEHDAGQDAECFARTVARANEAVPVANAAATAAKTDPGAQRMLAQGMPMELVLGAIAARQQLNGQASVPVRGVAPVPMPAYEASVGDGPGFYL